MNVIKPTKDRVRQYMADRRVSTTPPPQPADVRRELGWLLSPQNLTTSTEPYDPPR